MLIKLNRLIEFFIVWGIVGLSLFFLFDGLSAVQGSVAFETNKAIDSSSPLISANSLIANSGHHFSSKEFRKNELLKEPNKMWVAITAYSSTPSQTDSDPFITASGDWVEDGVVAANFLPFGTKIRIPELYGNKVFVVKDRMNPRKKHQIDIWFPSRKEAIQFGAHYGYIELVEDKTIEK